MLYKRALTIAGSDSGGGAGIQADLKTFSALGCYGSSVITALTAQNTKEVHSICDVPAKFIGEQIHAVLSDIGADAIKIGMLHRPEIIETVAHYLKNFKGPIVLDPVMIAKSGDRLLLPKSINILKKLLLPMATVLTPNLPEAEILLQKRISTNEDIESSAKSLLEFGVKVVVLKGGHHHSDSSDDYVCFYDEVGDLKSHWLRALRVKTYNTHGTGCTLSSAITAFLARGDDPLSAIDKAKKYLTKAIEHGAFYKIGGGHGPVHHFFNLWESLKEEDYEF